ncbi:MAG: right-handed parallel beta-helix repeat-containing protein [Candidatus Kerfeldbacteria bacterium]|nr:right-handed parallel beta-helix repeat-containing protein [Candidatus Kerfeldbacteria bacterium]
MYIIGDSYPVISRCIVANNEGVGIEIAGNPRVTMRRSDIHSNSLGGIVCNGGVYLQGNTGVSDNAHEMVACTIQGNTATDGAGLQLRQGAEVIARNCLILDNISSRAGGAVHCSASAAYLDNCTLFGNGATYGSALYTEGGQIFVHNSILWGNDVNPIGGDVPSILYSDIEHGWFGPTNMAKDPRFATFQGYEYILRPGSPCIDAGDPAIEDGISDSHPRWPEWYPNGLRSDMGTYGGSGNVEWVK